MGSNHKPMQAYSDKNPALTPVCMVCFFRYRPSVGAEDDKGWTSMGGIAEDVTEILLYNLESSTSYEFVVIASNQLGDSLASTPKLATTRGRLS